MLIVGGWKNPTKFTQFLFLRERKIVAFLTHNLFIFSFIIGSHITLPNQE